VISFRGGLNAYNKENSWVSTLLRAGSRFELLVYTQQEIMN